MVFLAATAWFEWVAMSIPSDTGKEQEGTSFPLFRSSTTQTRHVPVAGSPSMWHRVGMSSPILLAAERFVHLHGFDLFSVQRDRHHNLLN